MPSVKRCITSWSPVGASPANSFATHPVGAPDLKRLKSDPARIVIPEIGALACTSWLSAHGERSCTPGAELDLNKIGVRLKVKYDGRKILVNSHFNKERQSQLACALELRAKVAEILGETVVAEAEKTVALASASASLPPQLVEMTEEEKAWLAAWFDEHSEPADVTLEEAAAALAAHHAASSSTTSSSASAFAAVTQA